MRILVLDDEPARHDLFRIIFCKAVIVSTWKADEAIGLIRDGGPFDIVTLDHDLGPSGDGLSVARHIALMPEVHRPRQVLVHSSNPVGAQAMLDTLVRAGVDAMRVDPLAMARSAA